MGLVKLFEKIQEKVDERYNEPINSTEKPQVYCYKCIYCGKVLYSKDLLKTHIANEQALKRHNIEATETDEKIYQYAILEFEEDSLYSASFLFDLIFSYKDCAEYVHKCKERADTINEDYVKVLTLECDEKYADAIEISKKYTHISKFCNIVSQCEEKLETNEIIRDEIRKAEEVRRKNEMFKQAVMYMDELELDKATSILKKLGNYRCYGSNTPYDAKELLCFCQQGTPTKYKTAKDLMNNGEYVKAKDIFSSISMYKDSRMLCTNCDEKIYLKAIELFNSGNKNEAFIMFKKLKNYKRSSNYLKKCKK